MTKTLKLFSFCGICLLIAALLGACGEDKENIAGLYFPAMSNTTWQGTITGQQNAVVELQFNGPETGYYILTIEGAEEEHGKMDYLILGRILQLRKVPAILNEPWMLLESSDNKMVFEGGPNQSGKPTSLILNKK